MAFNLDLIISIIILIIAIILTVMRFFNLFSILKMLKDNHSEIFFQYSSRIKTPFLNIWAASVSPNINIDLMFTRKLKLDDSLAKKINIFRMITVLHILSLIAIVVWNLI